MPIPPIFLQLGIALGLGLLVGLQRERVEAPLAGIRTFPLVTVLGTLCALLADSAGGWVIAAGLLAIASLAIMGNFVGAQDAERHPGLTTEVAILAMFALGAYLVHGDPVVATVIGGGVAALLQYKGQLHGVAGKLSNDDVAAIMQFALIAMVALPVLPNRAYGPYGVWNPRNIWTMVVLIVGINLAGYIVFKFFGERTGVVASGLLGGLISSTATTVGHARRTVSVPESVRPATLVILIATTVMYARMLFLVAVLAPAVIRACAPPLLLMLGLHAILCLALWFGGSRAHEGALAAQNPSELRPALLFGAMYAGVLLAVAYARHALGDRGLYLVAGLSGFEGVDALTLSTARFMDASMLSADIGWRLLLLASICNTIFKGGIVAVMGDRALSRRVAVLFLIGVAAGIVLLFLWPHA